MSRNSLTYAFLPGESLWQDAQYQELNPACKQESPGVKHPSKPCQDFLNTSEKATLQWELEKRFVKFEKEFNISTQSHNPFKLVV